MRPVRAVDDPPRKALLTRIFGALGSGQLPHGQHHARCAPAPAVAAGHDPRRLALVVVGALHPGVEFDVAAQVEAVGDMVNVAQDFRLRRVALAPAPFLLEFGREAIGIVVAFDVAARTGIAVVVPHPTDVAVALEHDRAQTHAAERVQRAQAREPRAHDNHVQLLTHRAILPFPPSHRNLYLSTIPLIGMEVFTSVWGPFHSVRNCLHSKVL